MMHEIAINNIRKAPAFFDFKIYNNKNSLLNAKIIIEKMDFNKLLFSQNRIYESILFLLSV